MKIAFPDYANCSVNVTSSILRHYGLEAHHQTHPVVDTLLQRGYKNIVLMLFDGMGMDILRHALPENSFLRSHVQTELSAVYPSTTTCATTSLETASFPVEHAWLGWTLYFKEIEKPVDVFLNKSDGQIAADYDVAWRYIPHGSIFDQLQQVPDLESCCVSNFTDDVPVETLDEMFDEIAKRCADSKKRYIYAYWNEPDHTMHGNGCYHKDVCTIVQDINDHVEKLSQIVGEDTLIMITADHGLIDAQHHYLDDHPRMLEILEHRPTIEARAASFHVKKEHLESFPNIFREEYGDNFLLFTHNEFIEKFLGPGKMHPKIHDFVGDFMALATDHDCIDGFRSDFMLKGVHAGLTEQEMRVPLIVL